MKIQNNQKFQILYRFFETILKYLSENIYKIIKFKKKLYKTQSFTIWREIIISHTEVETEEEEEEVDIMAPQEMMDIMEATTTLLEASEVVVNTMQTEDTKAPAKVEEISEGRDSMVVKAIVTKETRDMLQVLHSTGAPESLSKASR